MNELAWNIGLLLGVIIGGWILVKELARFAHVIVQKSQEKSKKDSL